MDNASNQDIIASDKRKYIRLKKILPIQFTIVRLQGDLPGIDWENGETRDVSSGGLCLETKTLSDSTIRFLNQHNIYLDLRISTALKEIIKSVAEVAWYEKIDNKNAHYYRIGLKFRSIAASDLNKIIG